MVAVETVSGVAIAAIAKGASVLARAKPLRDKAGRFAKKAPAEDVVLGGSLAQAIALKFNKPHGYSACGKGQYKSAHCKAKSIMASAAQGNEPSSRQVQFVSDLLRE